MRNQPTSREGPGRRSLCTAVLLCFGAAAALAQARPSAADVKAAYLFNFGKFVRWPSATPGFELCVVGRDDIAPVLSTITAKEHIDGAPVRVRQFERAADARGCEIVFMGASESAHLEQDLAALAGSNALTVGDSPLFLERGGMIQFVLENKRVRFAVNLDAVKRTRLELSSELLRVAASVTGVPHAEGTP